MAAGGQVTEIMIHRHEPAAYFGGWMGKFNLDIREIHPLDKGFFSFTSLDFHKMEATVKLFESLEEGIMFWHDISLEQSTEWHLNYCETCKQ